jgi:hypothetical protein
MNPPQLANKWHELIEESASGESLVIDMPRWLSKATLDAYAMTPEYPYPTHELASRIGMGAFEYDLGALDGSENLLAKTYSNLLHVPTVKP